MTGLWAIQNRVQTTSPGGYQGTGVGAGVGVPPAKTGNGYGGAASAGFWLQIGGALSSAVGAYAEAQAKQFELRSQALSLEYQQTLSAINARLAESDAQQILEAGKQQVGMSGLQYAQVRGANRASAASRGIQAGVGSAAEVATSIDYAAESDRLTINSNTVRAASQRRLQATDIANQGALAGVSAANIRTSAGSINPALAAQTSFLGSAGRMSAQASYDRRYKN